MRKNISNFQKILIANVNWLGDVLFSSVAIKAIKQKYPDCYLACMVTPRCVDILKDNPNVDEIITFDEKNTHKLFISKIMFIFYLRKKKFNVVFLFHRSFTRALICYLAGIKRRIGYKRKKTDFLLTDKVEIPNSSLHRAEYFTNLVAAVGINPIDKCYDFYIDEEAVRKNIEMLSENGITQEDNYVVLNPGGNWDPKRWPAGSYAQLADKILQNLKLNVVISGAKKDVGLAENIKSQMQGKAVILTGKTNLKELGALFKGARAVISADSGPMHLAAALNVPVIALFGPTSPHITGPYGKSRHIILQKDVGCQIPCYEVTCPDNKCMKAISVNEVFEALKSILSDYAK